MTENVFELSHNYRVKSESFKQLLASLQKGDPTDKDIWGIMDLYLVHYDKDFIKLTKNNPKTMWLCEKTQKRMRKTLKCLSRHYERTILQ